MATTDASGSRFAPSQNNVGLAFARPDSGLLYADRIKKSNPLEFEGVVEITIKDLQRLWGLAIFVRR